MSALVVINLEKGQLAHQIIQELEMMTRAPELPWFRRHSLIEGNEFADRIAKSGCFRGRSLRTPVTKKEVYRRIRGHVQDLWLDRWRNSVKGREGSSGHGLSSPSLHRFKIKRNPDCVYGERDANARHYVLDCPRVVGVQEERRARGAIESKLLRNHSKLLEKAQDVAAELFLSCGILQFLFFVAGLYQFYILLIKNARPRPLTAYTDGSSDLTLSNGGAGINIILQDGTNIKIKEGAGQISSNFTCELTAIWNALDVCLNQPSLHQAEGILIYSDSISALEAIQKGTENTLVTYPTGTIGE
ncbi:hypothetical protein LAZ67_19000670 [Cordylochernes scorpioides]|uniref:RNase H type-1 domain-containing protein n=1 Tax=Cordylochernes scorpioides TaxID=51811 RepID=A0ABY6LHA4_9ARAC|nr:hypothetical protein LAZ67_19000670 [Cordylochernes scorpioides]